MSSDIVWLATFTGAYLASLGFFKLLNLRYPAPATPTVTDPGKDACRRLTAPQPFPTGRHRNPEGITR